MLLGWSCIAHHPNHRNMDIIGMNCYIQTETEDGFVLFLFHLQKLIFQCELFKSIGKEGGEVYSIPRHERFSYG